MPLFSSVPADAAALPSVQLWPLLTCQEMVDTMTETVDCFGSMYRQMQWPRSQRSAHQPMPSMEQLHISSPKLEVPNLQPCPMGLNNQNAPETWVPAAGSQWAEDQQP